MKNIRKSVSLSLTLIGSMVTLALQAAEVPLHILKMISQDLITFSIDGDDEMIQKALAIPGINLEDTNKYGDTALMLAAVRNHNTTVKLLLDAGAPVNIQSTFKGHTALILAAAMGNTHGVELLLGAGADINVQNNAGETALIRAARDGHAETLEILLAAGADSNLQDSEGNTALMLAARKGNKHIVQLLLNGSVDVLIKNKKGQDAHDIALENNHIETAALFDDYYPFVKPAA